MSEEEQLRNKKKESDPTEIPVKELMTILSQVCHEVTAIQEYLQKNGIPKIEPPELSP